MALNLEKGQKVDLTKGNEGLSKIKVGLGWDVNKYEGGYSFDLDSALTLLDENGKAINGDSSFVYYNNKIVDGVKHHGDNLTGEGDGDDEVISIDLTKVDENAKSIDIHVAIYNGKEKEQNFGMVSNTFVRILNEDTNEELLKYDMGEDYSTETRLHVGKVYRHNGEWKFQAVGQGFKGGFSEITSEIGL